jgi:hypothetical protein
MFVLEFFSSLTSLSQYFLRIYLQMVFSEFLEALACTSVFKDPNPYTLLPQKLSLLLNRDLYPPLLVRIKKLRPLIPKVEQV